MGKMLDAEQIEKSRTALDRMQGAKAGVYGLTVFVIGLVAKALKNFFAKREVICGLGDEFGCQVIRHGTSTSVVAE